MKKAKKLTALLCSLAMAASLWVLPVSAEISAEPVIDVTFDSGGDAYMLSDAELVEGRDGNAIQTSEASGSYATINDVSALESLTGDFTFSVWCYPTSSNIWWSRLYDIGDSDLNYIFLASSLGNNLPRFAMKINGIEQSFDSTKPLDINEWNNVTVTRENGTSKMYINGILSGTSTAITYDPSDIPTGQNYLGNSQFDADAEFDGMIDDFKVYASALTEAEVQELAAEAYERELSIITNQHDRYYIDVNFYEGDTEVYQTSSGNALTANVNIRNYTTQSAELSVKLLNGETELDSDSLSLAMTQEETVQLSAQVPEGTQQLQVTVSDNHGVSYDAAFIDVTDSRVEFPPASPEDSDETTFGAHDPTIFRDPAGGKYWAYSSHNLVYESDDLVNWTEHDYTTTNTSGNPVITVPESAKEFIEANYGDTVVVNGTYWAPDLLYVEDDEYPYWFYLSVSCFFDNNGNGIENSGEGGGQNSVIALVKAKSPGLWDGEYQDYGVVLASKPGYNTNAIDANIYTENGINYFIWGSFWRGIHGAVLDDDGRIEGIDYTSDATILSSSANNFGSRLFATPGGHMGPEGPYTINNSDNDYTYMFTSYGWLGTNYNCRIARTGMDMSDIIGSISCHTRFTDASGNQVGTAYAQQSNVSLPWGYKMIGSYKIGDGITYYGNGHNSVLHDDDGNWYYVQHSRKVADAAAYLQVRKMLWTEDGWPVVSPVVYAGEREQAVTETMLYGTWDIVSVGTTLYDTGVTAANQQGAYRGADMPVESYDITLKPDKTFEKGTWSFDGDHTVTLSFTSDGNASENEYFSAGDEMTLFVLPGYDKDARRSVLTVTGVNRDFTAGSGTGTNTDYIANFGIKASAMAEITAPAAIETTPTVIEKSENGNPELGFDADGNMLYGGDPAATVVGDTVYLVAGHDTSTNDAYNIPEWVMYSSKDMKNWTYHGPIMSASDISWSNDDTSAWASQMVEHNGKYYLYYCTWDKTSSAKQSIGVAVADSPTGPYTDIGEPLVKGTLTSTGETSNWNDIDPTVWVETIDGVEHRYLAWGNGIYYMCELNEDMISVADTNGSGGLDEGDIKTQYIANGETAFTEAPWLYKRDGKYYTFYAAGWREAMAYAVSDDLSDNTWLYGGIIMPPTATSNTNHPSVIDFNGKTYFIYHNGMLPNGSGYRRSICIQELSFDEDGNVLPLTEMSTGLDGTPTTIIDRSGGYIAHEEFTNSYADSDYPINRPVTVSASEDALNTAWEIVPGLADPSNENYVSIQSVNKPGLYIGVINNNVVLTQDSTGAMGDILTFKTVEALDGGDGVSFESVSSSGVFLTSDNGTLTVSYGRNPEAASFTVGGEVSPTPVPTPAPTPAQVPDADNSFEGLPDTIAVLGATAGFYATDGAYLYVGPRNGGGDNETGWFTEAAGVTGDAIVLASDRWANNSRGARIGFTTPYLLSGASAELKISVNVANGKLHYNDSTADDTNAIDITQYFTTDKYNTLRITIENNKGTFTRIFYVDGEEILRDSGTAFPVFWGTLTDSNNNQTKTYFDNLSIRYNAPAVIEPLAATVSDVSRTDSSVAFTLNDAAVFGEVDAIVAQYDADGALVGVNKASVTVTDDEQIVSVDYEQAEGAVSYKLYVWYDMMSAAAAVDIE